MKKITCQHPLWLALRVFALALLAAAPAHATITVLDYWRMGENDPGAVSGGYCTNTVDAVGGNTLTNTPVSGPYTTYTNGVSLAASAETGSALALSFTNGQYGTAALATNLVNNFGIECWVKPGSASGGRVLAYNGLRGNGWGLYLAGTNFEVLYGGSITFGSAPATPGVWTHLALVRNNGVAILYTNGVPAATNTSNTPLTPTGNFTVGGNAQYPVEDYNGLIDEVRVFTFAAGAFSTNDLLLNATNLLVTSENDSGAGSLRNAVTYAPNGAIITFTNTLYGQTILLTGGQIVLSNSITIDASALTNGVQINGNHNSRIFTVNSSVTVTLNTLTITNGYDNNDIGDGGGGILNFGTLTLNYCTLSGNQADNSSGGGVDNEATLTVNNSAFIGDHASNGGGAFVGGGGIFNFGVLAVNNSTFTDNQAAGADSGGGGGIESFATLTVNNSTFNGNQADNSSGGGGILNTGSGTLTLNNSTFSGNHSVNGGGGGIDNFSGTVTVNNLTFTSNQAGSGGGIDNGFYGTLSLTNSIICSNTASSAPNISGSYSGMNNLADANALLAPLGHYGGPTMTMPPLAGSPAIDAGSDAVTRFLATDQRGYPRISGTRVDIGAVEVQIADAPLVLTGSNGFAGVIQLTNGQTQINFTNLVGGSFTVFATTNLALPFNTWANLGSALESPVGSGQFQFTDLSATNFSRRFYRVSSP